MSMYSPQLLASSLYDGSLQFLTLPTEVCADLLPTSCTRFMNEVFYVCVCVVVWWGGKGRRRGGGGGRPPGHPQDLSCVLRHLPFTATPKLQLVFAIFFTCFHGSNSSQIAAKAGNCIVPRILARSKVRSRKFLN